MKAFIIAGMSFLCIGVSAAVARADKNADLAPPAGQFGKLLVEDDFEGKNLDSTWQVAKGTWEIVGGELVGREKADDKHAAVLTLKQSNRDSAIKFSFQLNGCQGFNLSLNQARGHLFRVVIRDDAVVITKDKDKRDPKSRVEQLAKSPAVFEPGVWYTMLVEIDGDEVKVRTDNDVNLSAKDQRLDVDKPGYRFVVRGQSIALDDLKVWEQKK